MSDVSQILTDITYKKGIAAGIDSLMCEIEKYASNRGDYEEMTIDRFALQKLADKVKGYNGIEVGKEYDPVWEGMYEKLKNE